MDEAIADASIAVLPELETARDHLKALLQQ